MRTIQKITCLLFFLVSSYSIAQTGVNVTYYNGTNQTFNVAATGKLYFETDNLFVKTDATTTPTTIPVNIIRKITFSNVLVTTTFGDNAGNVMLYPNPGSGVIRIQSEVEEPLKTKIYSLTGQLVLQGIYQSNHDIDVSALACGLYLVQVNGLTIKFSKK
ncbi:MAG TPA: T9SS type A sorting domain-containing protein [Flavobacterium sp.]|nr:T9SS type A sorting domain-containing protein [Flavobacterium sp.]HPJ10698.1 T9SS type A sorting domain-containing protein [Flavobacterium sp.]